MGIAIAATIALGEVRKVDVCVIHGSGGRSQRCGLVERWGGGVWVGSLVLGSWCKRIALLSRGSQEKKSEGEG